MNTIDISSREALSPGAQKMFDDIVTQRVLGASTHIKMIAEMIMDICERSENNCRDTRQMVSDIHRIADFFMATRGEASQAISNAILLMISGIDRIGSRDIKSASKYIQGNINSYHENAAQDLKRINNYTLSLIKDMKAVMFFDYSSTVNQMAIVASENGIKLDCYIPESKALDGGKPYLKTCVDSGHNVHFIPDSSMYHYVKKCDAAFIGAETYYHDGRVFNTVGSELLGLLCKEFKVPYYVLTPLIKLDKRALYGYKKPPIIIDIKERIGTSLDDGMKKAINFKCPELVEIPSEYITAFVTEEGIIPPWGMYIAALNYVKRMEDDCHED